MAVRTLNVAVGFHRDVTKLLDRFVKSEETCMTQFTQIWRDMNFLKVFMYREEMEIVLFTEECFRIILRLITSQQALPYRVGALFALYSCFTMQPSHPKVMIRVVAEQWQGIQILLEESQLEPWQNQVKFVFWTLVYQNSFIYAATPNSIGLVNICSEDEKSNPSGNISSAFDDYMNSDHKSLKELHERYMSMKDSLSPSSAKAIQMANKDLIANVERNVQGLYSKCSLQEPSSCRKVETSDSENNWSETSELEGEDDEDTFDRRRKVREKQMASHAKQSKSRRHRDTWNPNAATTSWKGKRRRGRPRRSENPGPKRNCTTSIFQDLDET